MVKGREKAPIVCIASAPARRESRAVVVVTAREKKQEEEEERKRDRGKNDSPRRDLDGYRALFLE